MSIENTNPQKPEIRGGPINPKVLLLGTILSLPLLNQLLEGILKQESPPEMLTAKIGVGIGLSLGIGLYTKRYYSANKTIE